MAIKLLIAEDEQIERSALKFIISTYLSFYEIVEEASNGIELLELAKINKPDVLLIDIKMPALDGISAMSQIKAFLPDAEFIIISAYTDFEYAQSAIKLGAASYLTKPIKNDDLIDILYKLYNKVTEKRGKINKEHMLDEKIKVFKPEVEKSVLHAIASLNADDAVSYLFDQFWNSKNNKYFCIIAYPKSHPYSNGENAERFSDYFHKNMNLVCEEFMFGFLEKYFLFILPVLDNDNISYQQKVRSFIAICFKNKNLDFELWTSRVVSNLKSLITELGKIVNRICPESSEPPKDFSFVSIDKKVDEVIEYINNNYAFDISLDFLAKKYSMSISNISKAFKNKFNNNFIDYVTMLRIDKAKTLLATTNKSIKEITYEVGYNSQTYFCKVFKKITGKNAGEYKRFLQST
jgi:two-component system response regulator YesN